MKNFRAAAMPGLQTFPQWWEHRGFRVAVQALLVVIFSTAAAYGKSIHPAMGIPGSSSLYWLGPMILGATVMRWKGSGVLMGVGMGFWTMPFGLQHTMGYNMMLYGSTGLLIDLIAHLPKMNIRNPFGAIITGLGAHLAKFAFIMGGAALSSVTKHFVLVGVLNSLGLHIAFGIAAGFCGWAVFRLGQGAGKKMLS
jgi:hypothetical protein